MNSERALTVVEDAPMVEAHGVGGTVELLGTNPQERLAQAIAIANLIAPVIRDRKLAKRIGDREYVLFEGWTLAGSLLGVFPMTEWVHPISNSDGRMLGHEARVLAKTLGGQTVGAAHAICTIQERNWSNRDEFALASMAQTRAGAKALRMPLGFVMQLAGYEATPYEEMTQEDREGSGGDLARHAPSAPRKAEVPRAAPLATQKQRNLIWARAQKKGEELGVGHGDVERVLKGVCEQMGFASSKEITGPAVDAILHVIEGWTLAHFGEPEPAEMETGDAFV